MDCVWGFTQKTHIEWILKLLYLSSNWRRTSFLLPCFWIQNKSLAWNAHCRIYNWPSEVLFIEFDMLHLNLKMVTLFEIDLIWRSYRALFMRNILFITLITQSIIVFKFCNVQVLLPKDVMIHQSCNKLIWRTASVVP